MVKKMAHITVADGIPGIRSLALFRPETGKPLYALVQVLLRGPSPLTIAERELIAAYVSVRNNCTFCFESHAAAARCLYGPAAFIVNEVVENLSTASVSKKFKTLLAIAGKVQVQGTSVNHDDINDAKNEGASDLEIHDTVLIAAVFSMFNRYVDGLATFTPTDPATYKEMGERMVNGYELKID
jgi:uncharacterized peroxidase-related enzyme